jgi:HupE / UreJ protein
LILLVRHWANLLNFTIMAGRFAISRIIRGISLAALIFALPYAGFAHTIPDDIKVQAFVKPEGNRIYLLVRVPADTGTDIIFPERENGILDLAHAEPTIRGAVIMWLANNIDLYENDTLLRNPRIDQAMMSLQSDKSFASYDEALAHLTGPRLPNDTQVYWQQTFVDAMLEYPIQSDRSRFSFHPRFTQLAVRVVNDLQFIPPSGSTSSYEFLDDPGLIRFDPAWYQTTEQFIKMGFSYFLAGADYLVFLLCLVIPFRRIRSLLLIVISFTVAQTITLIASAYHFVPDSLWFPPLIETLIAISIVYLALENIVGKIALQRRRILAFGVGLVLGFSYAFALTRTLQFAESHELDAVLSFNVGVGLCQLLALAILVLGVELLVRRVVDERTGTIVVSGLVLLTAWRSMLDRGERLWQYQFEWPTLTAASEASALRVLMVILILAFFVWLIFGVLGSWLKRHPGDRSAEVPQQRQ